MKTRLLVLLLMFCAADARAQSDDPIAPARDMALSGHHAEATQLLLKRLEERPDDVNARTLLGAIHYWDGDYAAAREELEAVLEIDPIHVGALPILIDVELADSRPARAQELALRGLAIRPGDVSLLIRSGRALNDLDRRRDARQQLDRAVRIDPGNDEALRTRRSLRPLRLFTTGFGFGSEKLNDSVVPWREVVYAASVSTPAAEFIGRMNRGQRFDDKDDQFELEATPTFRPGTFAKVSVAYSQDKKLYPEYRVSVDFTHDVGGGFELSGGARQLSFSNNLNVYTASVSKYHGGWQLTGRMYYTPDMRGTKESYQAMARLTYGPDGANVLGFGYAHGSARSEIRDVADLDVLNANIVIGDMVSSVTKWFGMLTRVTYGNEELTSGDNTRLAVSSAFFLKF